MNFKCFGSCVFRFQLGEIPYNLVRVLKEIVCVCVCVCVCIKYTNLSIYICIQVSVIYC
jgi:hypothetical protein